jgi:hypothetical protein
LTTLIVPPLERRPWPTLGPDVCDFIESFLVYGPGERKGDRYEIEPEFRAQIYRSYEVFPKDHRLAGRRRFKRVALEMRKGTAKTEKAALLAICEAHPAAPVRCDGWRWRGKWVPVGRGVRDPYIPMLAYTKDQVDELAFFVAKSIIEESDVAGDFDTGEERILVLDDRGKAAGKIVGLAGSPAARDGARTTFQHFDEPHRLSLPKQKKAHSTMLENVPKRVGADAWSLETTTAGEPGEGSVAEDTRFYAEQIAAGKVDDPRLFYFARWAPDTMPMDTPEQVREALLEASGPAAEWSGDIDALVSRWFEPRTDRSFFRRVWLNQWVPGGGRAFDPDLFRRLADPAASIPEGSMITLGFDGARRHDSTGLVATEVETGLQSVLGVWERPDHAGDDWEIDAGDVEAVLVTAFDRWKVWRLYADPPYWADQLDAWAGRWGERVVKWWTNRRVPMAYAVRAYRDAILDGSLSHDGHPVYEAHVGNAVRKELPGLRDEDGEPLWLIRKERPDSPKKIDLAMAGCLSWEARGDAIAAGALKVKRRRGGSV